MKVIAIANQKGGIGKTTTACATASILKKKGYKVLMIDTDMQCNTTSVYNAKTDGEATVYDVVVAKESERVDINESIQHLEYGDIVASDRLLVDAETVLSSDKLNGLFRLQEAISKLKGYDYVIIDTNPSLNTMLFNVLIAVDSIVVPITADRFGIEGLSQLTDTIISVKQRYNRNLKISGLLVVKYKAQTTMERQLRAELEGIAQQLGTKVFETSIRESIKVRESQLEQIPLEIYAPNCTSCADYENYVEELLKEV